MDHGIRYNSDIFCTTDSGFRMEACIDHPKKCASIEREICMEIHARKIPWTMKLTITQPFFELQTQDFVWNFI